LIQELIVIWRNLGQFMILHTTAELANLSVIRRFVEDSARSLSADGRTAEDLAQAVDECATNIIEHGYRGEPGTIEVEIVRAGETLTVVLRDHAPPFDPTRAPLPDLTGSLEEREPGGLGLYLTRRLVDDWHYRALPDDGNELTLVKQITATTSWSSF
jgi:anti-sigma regulatory factor (Ser/Thr protein kinase)